MDEGTEIMKYKTHHAEESEELRGICYSQISYLQNQVLKLQQSVRHRDKHMAKVRLIVKQRMHPSLQPLRVLQHIPQ